MQTSPTKPSTISIPDVRATIHGRVIGPDDSEYDKARTVVAGGIDRRPAVIVRVADTDDVATVIALARKTGLELAVRSGGHSGAGHGVTDGGIVLDLADMKALDIDVPARTAWAETGLTAAEYSNAAALTAWRPGSVIRGPSASAESPSAAASATSSASTA